ncbi:Integrase [Modestobacter italicus]|uniref:Integrase n=1 Tax=Modestobacter italicus (strain DSM 44449 / CECT 9708 / BC 501) TaxID=2732864 RepID=I4F0W9_MODI5|nr:Integrase [Modestobacter marinus]
MLNGLRISEALAARVEDVDHDRGHRVLRIHRKGGRRAKTPLTLDVQHVLDQLIGERTTGPIFTTTSGKPLDRTAAWRLLRRLATNAGIASPDRISPHSARHTYATTALNAGVALRDVQDFMRQRDPRPPGSMTAPAATSPATPPTPSPQPSPTSDPVLAGRSPERTRSASAKDSGVPAPDCVGSRSQHRITCPPARRAETLWPRDSTSRSSRQRSGQPRANSRLRSTGSTGRTSAASRPTTAKPAVSTRATGKPRNDSWTPITVRSNGSTRTTGRSTSETSEPTSRTGRLSPTSTGSCARSHRLGPATPRPSRRWPTASRRRWSCTPTGTWTLS